MVGLFGIFFFGQAKAANPCVILDPSGMMSAFPLQSVNIFLRRNNMLTEGCLSSLILEDKWEIQVTRASMNEHILYLRSILV